MAVAYDASSSSSTGTGNLSWTHTPTGTPKGVWVSVLQYNTFGDEVTSVTYGGVAMTETADSPYADNSTEDSAIYSYYLGSSIPTGAQTVVVTVSGASSKQACAITVTAATDTEVQDTATHVATSDATTTTLALGGNSSFCALAFMSASNIATSTAPISGWTQRLETDFGNEVGGVHTYDTVGTSDVSFSISNTTVRRIALGVAITESAGASTQDITPSLFSDGDTFYTPVVLQPGSLFPALFSNTNTFYAPTVDAPVSGTQITSTELGATGRYVYFDQAAFDDLGSQTVLAYCRPTGSGGGGYAYIYGKTPTGSINGPRLFIDHNAGAPRLIFGASSSTDGTPQRMAAADSAVYNSWGHYAATWDGSLTGANILLYAGVGTDVSETSYGTTDNGSGSVTSDAANPAYLMNRYGLGREFVGDVAYIAVWDSVLTLTQLQNAQNNGPLEEPTGLVLLWANQADLSTNALTETGRSTYAAGAIPPNTLLGGTATLTPALFSNTNTFYAATVSNAAGTQDLTPALFSNTNTFYAAEVGPLAVISDSYERSSINVSGSSITGLGDSALIVLKPRVQESEVVSSQTRWLEPSARIDNVNGYRPTFRFSDYAATAAAGTYHGAPWQSTRYPMFSYDRETWHYFDTKTVNTTYVEFRHSTAFTSDTVYISRGRQVSVTQEGDWLAALATSHSSIVVPTTTAAAFTPTLTSWPAQSFIADEFSAQTDELSRTIPACPFYAYEINDTSLMPAGGVKRLAVLAGGVHAGEDQANIAMREFVTALLGSTTEAQDLRRQYRVLVYPMVNAPGRSGGGWRGSFTQGTAGIDDANRHFSDASPGLEIITKPRTAMLADMDGEIPDWMIDFHGDYGNQWALFVDDALQTTFRTRLATDSGFTVTNVGATTSSGFVSRWYQDTIGTLLAVTLEHGDPAAVTDANLVTWGEAIVTTLDSMRADGLLFDTTTLSPPLFVDGDTFHSATVTTGAVTLTPGLFSDADTFHAATVSQGGAPQDLAPALFVDADTFHAATVSAGAVTLAPTLFTDSDTFYTPAVVVDGGPQTLTPELFTDADTFHAATVTPGAVTLAPSLYTDADTFYAAEIASGFNLQPPAFADADAFYAATISVGPVTLAPALFIDSDTFYPHSISGGTNLLKPTSIFGIASERRIFTVANEQRIFKD